MDYVLRLQFYSLCYPVIKRKMTMASKCSAIGKPPKVFLATKVTFHDLLDKLIAMNHVEYPLDFVIDVRRIIKFRNWDFVINKNILKYVEFNHIYVDLVDSLIPPLNLKVLFNPNVKHATILGRTNVESKSLFKLMPNLQSFWTDQTFPRNFEQMLLSFKKTVKPVFYEFHVEKVNLKLLREFLLQQSPNFHMILHMRQITFEVRDLMVHFNRQHFKYGWDGPNTKPSVKFEYKDPPKEVIFFDGEFTPKA
uniref:DUF38 domain-containing protein n=1 Tax=Panagrolaimus sp. JU765 TaxID=591449 RepID=A0AC34QHS9_9BILA